VPSEVADQGEQARRTRRRNVAVLFDGEPGIAGVERLLGEIDSDWRQYLDV